MEKLFFNECMVDVDLGNGFIETIFDDKTTVPSLPIKNPTSLYFSHDLGYEDDVKLMTIHNQLLHTFLMERAGFPFSPTLWATAHQAIYEDEYWEKAFVLSFQKYLNFREADPILKDTVGDIRKLAGAARNLLEFTYV